MKYNTITKQVSETVPGGIYEQIDYHGEPPADVAARAGWVDVTPKIQLLIDAAKAEQDAANAAALAEADAKWKAEEDKRIMALPSIAAIVADANILRAENAALKEKLAAAEVQLATVKATADKAAADVATLKAAKPVEPVPK
jgi:hypothetical protein